LGDKGNAKKIKNGRFMMKSKFLFVILHII
jgi:hypothetical protein